MQPARTVPGSDGGGPAVPFSNPSTHLGRPFRCDVAAKASRCPLHRHPRALSPQCQSVAKPLPRRFRHSDPAICIYRRRLRPMYGPHCSQVGHGPLLRRWDSLQGRKRRHADQVQSARNNEQQRGIARLLEKFRRLCKSCLAEAITWAKKSGACCGNICIWPVGHLGQ